MRIRANLTLRNERMLAARESLGLTQKTLAELAEVPIAFISHLEALNYSEWETPSTRDAPKPRADWDQRARRVADALELHLDVVLPPDLRGHRIESSVSRIAEVDASRLLELKGMQPQCLTMEVESSVMHDESRRQIHKALKTLTYREREIVKMRYGLSDGNSYSLDEMSHIFKISRARVQQIEATAIRKLRRPHRAASLIGLLD